MNLQDRIVVVTGGANGIGRAMCRRFAQAGAARVVVSDRDISGASAVADEIGGLAIPCDVRSETDIQKLVERTLEDAGPIDLFVSNAGITVKGGIEVTNDDWQRAFMTSIPVVELGGQRLELATSPSRIRRLLADVLDAPAAAARG